MKRVALVTSSLHPKLDIDGALLLPALAAVGIDAQPAIWDDASVDWSSYDLCVIRSTWDYHNRLEEFLAWTENVATKTQLWNSPDTIRWNAKKTYLQELADSGISIVPTMWLQKGSHVDVVSAMVELKCKKAVIKPTVSANSDNTHVVRLENAEGDQNVFDAVVRNLDMMMQPYVSSIETRGEVSLLFFQEEFSHAVRKTPKAGEFRSQEGFGSTIEAYDPTEAEVEFGKTVLSRIFAELLYGRVDVVYNDDGALLLTELELIEPSLFLRFSEKAANRFAKSVKSLMADSKMTKVNQ